MVECQTYTTDGDKELVFWIHQCTVIGDNIPNGQPKNVNDPEAMID